MTETAADPEAAFLRDGELRSARRYAVLAAVAAIVSVLIGAVSLVFIAHLHSRLGKRTAGKNGNDGAAVAATLDAVLTRHLATLSEATAQGLARLERRLDSQRSTMHAESDPLDHPMSPEMPPSPPPRRTEHAAATPGRVAPRTASAPAVSAASATAARSSDAAARVDLGLLMSTIMQAIRTVAESGSPITPANVATRIASAVASESQRAELARAGMTVEFYDGAGSLSSQAADLIAIRLDAISGARRFVFPFPYAGKVARYVYWFGQGDYKTNPVLADLPATAEVGTDGTLTKIKNGTLRKS